MSKLFKKLSVLLFVFAIFVVFEAKNINVFADDMFEYHETFNNSTATASYADGSFTGVNGVTWTYGHSRDEEGYGITGSGLMLRRASDSYLEATFPNGIGKLAFDYRKAFTGSSSRQIEVLINGDVKGTTSAFGASSGADGTIYNFELDVNLEGPVTVKIKLTGSSTDNRQTTIDNFKWNEYSNEPEGIKANVTQLLDIDNQVPVQVEAKEYGHNLEIPVGAEGYTFAFWVVNGVVRKDLSNTSENFAVTEELEIQQVYYPEGKHAVLFVDSNGKLIETTYVSDNASVTAPSTDDLSKPGYQVKSENKWLSNEGSSSLESINSSRVYVLQYEKVNLGQYTITVGEDTHQYEYNDIATVTTELENFTHWEENGKVVSTSVEYSFTVTRNRTLVPVSNLALLNTSRVILSDDLEVRDGYQTFMAQIDLLPGETIVEYGLVVSQNANDKYDDIVLETEAVEKAQGNVLHPITKEFVMSFDTKYHVVRAYLVTRDGEGNLTTVYSENQYSNAIIVNFNTDGVEGIENIVLVKQGKVTAPAAPEKEYYIFDGWFADAELTIPFDFNQIITQDTTIYAKWLEDLPTIAEVRSVSSGQVEFDGIVTMINGTNIFVQDDTAAIYVYNANLSEVEVEIGDKIRVDGFRTDYRGLVEIGQNATITILSRENPLPMIKDLEDISKVTANIQSQRVSIEGLKVESKLDGLYLTDGSSIIELRLLGENTSALLETAIVGQTINVIQAFVDWYDGPQLAIFDIDNVEPIPLTDQDYAEIVLKQLKEQFDGKTFIGGTNATIPETGDYGTTIEWMFDPEEVVLEGEWINVSEETVVFAIVYVTKGNVVVDGEFEFKIDSTPVVELKTVTITGGGSLAPGSGYDNGAVRTQTFSGIVINAVYTLNNNGDIQGQKNNMRIWNVTSLGNIKSITINQRGTQTYKLYAGTNVISSASDSSIKETVSSGTNIASYTWNLEGKNVSHFLIHNGSGAIYITSIVIEYYPN